MYLPEHLKNRRFTEWNYLVRGLVEIWEMARLMGVEERVEGALKNDKDGTLTEILGKAGNDWPALACAIMVRNQAGMVDKSAIRTLERIDTARTRGGSRAPKLEAVPAAS